jgi:hypothetical protein
LAALRGGGGVVDLRMPDEEDDYFAINILPAYYACVIKFILNKIIYKLFYLQ